MRVGHGYDTHRFAEGRKLVLGGVTIPYERGLAAHSDGDVVVHALCDALLGAAGLGDIGGHFPDSQAEFKDVDSRLLLRRVMEQLRAMGLRVSNADVTVQAERPKLGPHIREMRSNLSADLGIETERLNIKATTMEGMGFVGRSEGIAAHAVALLDEPS